MARKNQLMFTDDKITFVEEALLRGFFPEGKSQTLSELQKRSGYSYERVNTNLNSLRKKGILKQKKVGKTLVYTPDLHSLYLRFAFYHYMLEKIIQFGNKHKNIYKALREIQGKTFEILIIYGSYSKDTETKSSDIDLLIATDFQKEREEEMVNIKRKYGLTINAVFVDPLEFQKIKKENKELWGDLKQNAIVLEGDGWFYYWMYQNEST